MTDSEKKKLLFKANKYDEAKDEVGKETVNNFRFLKADLSAWYNALTTVCFTVGAIAITIGSDSSVRSKILHPAYFWWGTALLLIDGVLIFLLKKWEIEGEFNEMPKLAESKADYWQLRNMTIEKANGNNSRAAELKKLEEHVTDQYKDTQKAWPWYKWIGKIIHGLTTDLAFGLLVFPIALMFTQITNELRINFSDYLRGVVIALILYVIYMIWGIYKSIRSALRQKAAEARVRKEVLHD